MRIENIVFKLAGISYRKSGNGLLASMVSDTRKLFEKSISSICIISGGFSYKFYCDDGIISAIEKALERKCTVEVIVGPEANKKSLQTWDSLGVPFYVLKECPDRHFAVVDGKHVRVEEPHPPGTEKQVQYVVYNFKNADELIQRFEELKKQAKKLEIS